METRKRVAPAPQRGSRTRLLMLNMVAARTNSSRPVIAISVSGSARTSRQHLIGVQCSAVVLEPDAGQAQSSRLRQQVTDFVSRDCIAQAGTADVRHAVALGVGAPGPRAVGQVGTKAVR